MGKVAIISSIVITFLAVTVINQTRSSTERASEKHYEHQSGRIAKNLAEKGQKLVLAEWVKSHGLGTTTSFDSLARDGGSIKLLHFAVDSAMVEFTIRGESSGAVHDIHSRFKWNGFGINPLQIKAAALDMTVSHSAKLNFGRLTLDDQAIVELNDVLFNELEMSGELSDYGMGFSVMSTEVTNQLKSNHSGIAIDIIDQTDRDDLDKHNGIYFPDQVQQAIDNYLALNPGGELVVYDAASIPTAFGSGSQKVIRVKNDALISGDVTGSGILIVEGDLNVPKYNSLNWQGIVLVSPPAGELNPRIDFEGVVSISGGLIAIHESIPNTGHMDITTFRDYSGYWDSPFGVDMHQSWWPYWLYHIHDFTSVEGNTVRFMAETESDRTHESYLHFYETLQGLSENDDILLEYYHPDSHGRSILTMELAGKPLMAHPVAAGFHPLVAKSGNVYKTEPFKVKDLKYLQIDVKRLSSLHKMWDDSDNPYPNCTLWDAVMGPLCVAEQHNRHHSLALRIYKKEGASEKHIYESTMYWHRREDEEEAFASEMQGLVDVLGSTDFGLEINLGDSTTINMDPTAAHLLGAMSGISTYVSKVDVSSSKWGPFDENNPVTKGIPDHAKGKGKGNGGGEICNNGNGNGNGNCDEDGNGNGNGNGHGNGNGK